MKKCFSLVVLLSVVAALVWGCANRASKGYNPAVPTSFSFTNNYVLTADAIDDAPIDGQYYDRYNGTWQVDQTDLSFTNNYLSSATNVNVNSTTGSFQVVNFSTANIKPTFVEGATFGKSGFFGTDTEVAMNNGYLRLTNVWLELASGSGSMIYMQGNPIDMGGGTITNLDMQGQAITNATIVGSPSISATDMTAAGSLRIGTGAGGGTLSANLDVISIDNNLQVNGVTGFTGKGGNLTELNASQLSSGTVPNARLQLPVEFIIAASDETNQLTTGDSKTSFRAPFAFTITNTYADVNTAPSGSALVVGLRNAGTRIATNTIAIGGTGSTNSIFSPSTTIAKRSLLSVDIISTGTSASGLKVTFQGYRTP